MRTTVTKDVALLFPTDNCSLYTIYVVSTFFCVLVVLGPVQALNFS